MELGHAVIGPEGGYIAGRQLLAAMYTARFGAPLPKISVTVKGKPFFDNSPVYFSISHTKHHVFCVLSHCPVGIDAEETDRNIRLELSDKILSVTETVRYRQTQNKKQALLRLWVLKEAAVKCSGSGLNGYPKDTDFSPDDPRIQEIHGCYVAVFEEN